MCGIAGLLLAPCRADPARLAAIGPMTARLRHRGPDGDGFWHDAAAGVAFGHRRLAIVDLSEAGRQPMQSHDGRLVVCYNGEIYNAPELRPELERQGHAFRGHSDTEIMLAAFETFGVERALPRLAGMFATALWDRREHVLHLVRDRLGKKPLYISVVDGALLFASELKALREYPGFEPKIDAGALAMLLRHGWIPDTSCIWQDTFKLPPGGLLSVRAEDLRDNSVERLRARVRTWWSLAEVAHAGQNEPLDLSDSDAADELDRLLRIAVGERMLADVPLGAFLSGGIDSSTVVAMMQARSSRPIRTFTIGFQEAHYDEAHNASLISRHLGTDHTEFRVTTADAYQVIPRIPEIWDEPFADEFTDPDLSGCATRAATRYGSTDRRWWRRMLRWVCAAFRAGAVATTARSAAGSAPRRGFRPAGFEPRHDAGRHRRPASADAGVASAGQLQHAKAGNRARCGRGGRIVPASDQRVGIPGIACESA